MKQTDPVDIVSQLIAYPSISPDNGDAQSYIGNFLKSLNFHVQDMSLGEGALRTSNLFASIGQGSPHLCFAGHSDVVPSGDDSAWDSPPFSASIRDGYLFGRGACDMKGNIAAFLAALARLKQEDFKPSGMISLFITGDEEAKGTYGTKAVLPLLKAQHHIPDFCIVGEPSSQKYVGDTIKVGRRGSLNVQLLIEGVQGHVAYPHKCDNPLHPLIDILKILKDTSFDEGTKYFQPSSLQITSIDVGNEATNVTPHQARARFNIRFNDRHTGADLVKYIENICYRYVSPENIKISYDISGEAFITQPNKDVFRLQNAIGSITSQKPVFDTGGGTSDARFLVHYCPTVELGVVGSSLHKINEFVSLKDLELLTQIYKKFIEDMER